MKICGQNIGVLKLIIAAFFLAMIFLAILSNIFPPETIKSGSEIIHPSCQLVDTYPSSRLLDSEVTYTYDCKNLSSETILTYAKSKLEENNYELIPLKEMRHPSITYGKGGFIPSSPCSVISVVDMQSPFNQTMVGIGHFLIC